MTPCGLLRIFGKTDGLYKVTLSETFCVLGFKFLFIPSLFLLPLQRRFHRYIPLRSLNVTCVDPASQEGPAIHLPILLYFPCSNSVVGFKLSMVGLYINRRPYKKN